MAKGEWRRTGGGGVGDTSRVAGRASRSRGRWCLVGSWGLRLDGDEDGDGNGGGGGGAKGDENERGLGWVVTATVMAVVGEMAKSGSARTHMT